MPLNLKVFSKEWEIITSFAEMCRQHFKSWDTCKRCGIWSTGAFTGTPHFPGNNHCWLCPGRSRATALLLRLLRAVRPVGDLLIRQRGSCACPTPSRASARWGRAALIRLRNLIRNVPLAKTPFGIPNIIYFYFPFININLRLVFIIHVTLDERFDFSKRQYPHSVKWEHQWYLPNSFVMRSNQIMYENH